MIAFLIHEGKRVAIGDGGDLPTLARELGLIGATVVNRNGLVSTCQPFNYEELSSLDRHFGSGRPASFEFNHAAVGGYN